MHSSQITSAFNKNEKTKNTTCISTVLCPYYEIPSKPKSSLIQTFILDSMVSGLHEIYCTGTLKKCEVTKSIL